VENFSAIGVIWISVCRRRIFHFEKFTLLPFYASSSVMKFSSRIFLCLLILSLLSSSCSPQNKNQPAFVKADKKQLIASLNDSIFCISVIIKGADYENRYSVGTGFLVGDGLMATAAHVQSKAKELPGEFMKPTSTIVAWKRFATGEVVQFPIEIAAIDQKSDLAVYRFDDKNFRANPNFAAVKPLTLAENLPPLGTEVVSIGFYGTYEFPFNSLGNIAMIDVNEDIFSDLTLMPGNSGAPVCDLENGEVLGVTTDVLDLGNETVRYGIAKRAAKLKELLRKFQEN
jgi:S1-C subfamily serine protease